jgi:Protein of unknown function (DUF3185)
VIPDRLYAWDILSRNNQCRSLSLVTDRAPEFDNPIQQSTGWHCQAMVLLGSKRCAPLRLVVPISNEIRAKQIRAAGSLRLATTSFSSDISRFLTGSPTDKAIWMLLGGVVASIVGVVGLLRREGKV